MRKIDMGELREKQMQILDYVAQFCDEHGIRYIIEGGTMLGAIRHGGYIPWDDDIDVGMLREDYQRFIELFSQEAKDGYVFACSETTEGWHLPFGKVMDTNTLLVQDGHNLGINIDIFPYDDAPEDPQVMKKMYDTRDRLKVLNAIQCSKEKPSGNLIKRLAVYGVRAALHCFPEYYFIRRIEKSAQRFNGKGYKNLGMFTGESRITTCKKEWIQERTMVPFENRKYKVPVNYDGWLRSFFGEYMELPPVEKRKQHTFEAYLSD